MKWLFFGNGYVTKHFIKKYPTTNVHVITRNPSLPHHIALNDIEVIKKEIRSCDVLVSTVPPNRDTGTDLALDHLKNIAPDFYGNVIYVSSTSVYGNHDGAIVDETTSCTPTTLSGQYRLYAETEWQKTYPHCIILRLAGIYGPGRSVFDTLKNNTARRIHKPGHFFSRIHIDDIIQAISLLPDHKGGIYNLADDAPAPTSDLIVYACTLLNQVPPSLENFNTIKDTLPPMLKEFYTDLKRINCDKIKTVCKLQLQYPNYRAGLDRIFSS